MRFPALHHELSGVMIELGGVQALDHAEVVCTSGEVREEIGEPHACPSVLPEGATAAHEGGSLFLEEGEAHLFQESWIHLFAIEFL